VLDQGVVHGLQELGAGGLEAGAVLEHPGKLLTLEGHLFDLPLLHLLDEVRERYGLVLPAPGRREDEQGKHHQDDDEPEEVGAGKIPHEGGSVDVPA